MAAKDHVNPQQLKLFMTPQEIMGTVYDSVDRDQFDEDEESMEDLWDSKLDESKWIESPDDTDSLYDSIEKYGVRRHISLMPDRDGDLWMGQGHHRVAAAADISKRTGKDIFIPVLYGHWNESDEPEYAHQYPQNVLEEDDY